jgi:hypothetical protein
MGLEINPTDPNELWFHDPSRIEHSTDGGVSWSTIGGEIADGGDGAIDLAVFPRPGRPAVIMAVPVYKFGTTEEPAIFRSEDGGFSFARIPLHFQAWTVAFGKTPDRLVITTMSNDSKVYRFEARAHRAGGWPWTDITPPVAPTKMREVASGGAPKKSFFYRTNDWGWEGELILLRYDGKV